MVVGLSGVAGLLLLSSTENAATRIDAWPWPVLLQGTLLIPHLLLAHDLWWNPGRRTPGGQALAALALATAASVAFSALPTFSLQAAAVLFSGYSLAAWVSRQAAAFTPAVPKGDVTRGQRLAGACLLLPVAASAALFFADSLRTDSLANYLIETRNPHPFGHWNFTSGYALLILPWLLHLAWRDPRLRLPWLGGVALAGLMLFSGGSRGAVLALVVLGALATWQALSRLQNTRLKAALLLGAAGLATVVLLSNPRLRAFALGTGGRLDPSEGDVQRLAMLEGGWRLLEQRWVLGHGPGMTPFAYAGVRGELVGGVETAFQLHVTPLQLAVDGGLFGLGAALAVAVVALLSVRRRRHGDNLPWTALPAGYSLFGYLVFSLTDYQLNVPAFVAGVSINTGLLLGLAKAQPAGPVKVRSRLTAAAVVFGGGALLCLQLPDLLARSRYYRAWWETDAARPEQKLALLESAANAAPRLPLYRASFGLELLSVAFTVADAPTRATLQHAANTQLEAALALDPRQEPLQAALGWSYLRRGEPERAAACFRAALALIPDRDATHLGLALAQLQQGDTPRALLSLGTALAVQPAFALSPLWADPPLASLRQPALEAAQQVITQSLEHRSTPRWRHPELRYARAWLQWWSTGQVPTADELTGAFAAQRTFFLKLGLGQEEVTPTLQTVLQVWAQGGDSKRGMSDGLSEAALAGLKARLARAPAAAFADLLRMPAAPGEGLRETLFRQHYRIMHRNMDGPGLPDFAPRSRDPFLQEVIGFTVPLPGLLPGPTLFRAASLSPASVP